jgi:hypothetical protein
MTNGRIVIYQSVIVSIRIQSANPETEMAR